MLTVATCALLGLLAIFAVVIAGFQARARHDAAQRFIDRARVSAELTESLLSSAFRTAEALDSRLYGGAHVSPHTLDPGVQSGALAFSMLFAPGGRLLAISSRAPVEARRLASLASSPLWQVLNGRSYFIGGEQSLGGGLRVVQSAQAVATRFGRRVLLVAIVADRTYEFLGGYIRKLPAFAGGEAYVVDGAGTVLGSTDPVMRPGRLLAPAQLLFSPDRAVHGSLPGSRYFASEPVSGSSWRVVLTTPTPMLFAAVRGVASWLPWLALSVFAILGGLALGLVRGLMRAGRQLQETNRALRSSITELAGSEERMRLLIDGAVDYALFMVDPEGRIASWNEGAERLYGYVAEEVIHRDLSLLYAPEDVSAGKPAADLASAVRNGREESETWRLRKNGRRFWANIVTVALYNDDGSIRGFSRITRDMTDRKRAEEQLLHDALHDTLTGLPNRALFTDRLTQALAHATRRPDYRCAVLFLDIDRFKVINDTHTHEVGDELLIGFARRLVGCLRPGDTVARLGGDEFTILVDDIRSPDEASVVARRVQRALQAPLRIGGRELALSASVGIALSTRGMTAAELMRNADIAMYDAKRHGKSRSATFDTGMHTRVARELEVESKLRSAINSERLNIAYQPIVELATGRLQGFEALARWPMDEPAIPASEFIKVAEESGLIGELGTFILDRACVRLSDWRDRGLIPSDATMSVNVSRHQLDEPSLIQAVRTALARARLPANALCLEITETAMVHEPHGIQAAIARFTEIGVQAHIDDFGMGYSSLAFLRSFAGNAVKIDRSYIASIHSDETSEAIVRAILELARTLDVRSIAEGVEHEAQLEKLLDLGCESAQGFLFSRALLAQEVETLIRSWDHHVTMQALAQSRSQAARS